MDNSQQQSKTLVIVDASKNEIFTVNDGLKSLQRKLKSNGFKVSSNKEDINGDLLNQALIFLICGARAKFSENELNQMRKYVAGGGKLIVMGSEGGEKRNGSNINSFLHDYGITFNDDVVVRTAYCKYFHPKEVLITDGVLNRAIHQQVNQIRANNHDITGSNFHFVYPYGGTLNVSKPAVAVLSTGSTSFPVSRPVCAFYEHKGSGGKIIAMASVHVFHESYLDKENNQLLKEVFINFLTKNNFELNQIDAQNPEIAEYAMIPDIELLAEEPLSCLQESEEIPSDYTRLFNEKLFEITDAPLANVIKAYDELQMVQEPLRLIKPQFETPLPALEPAVFPPTFRELPKPSIELFDLDSHLSSTQSRLMQTANKCTDSDLDYFIKESGLILGIPDIGGKTSKEILYHVFSRIVDYKKVNADGP